MIMKCKYEGDGVWADRCKGTKEVDPCVGYDKCKMFKADFTSNADRIRAMSDEELAKVLTKASFCSTCLARNECIKTVDDDCAQTHLIWLKQPAEG